MQRVSPVAFRHGFSPRRVHVRPPQTIGDSSHRFALGGFAPGTPLAFTPGRYLFQARSEGRMTERRVFDVPKDPKDQLRIFITMAKKAAE